MPELVDKAVEHHRVEIGGDHPVHSRSDLQEQFESYDPRRLSRTLVGICSRANIPYVDLTSTFVDIGAESLYMAGWNDHWNDRGQDVAAREVADYLVENEARLRVTKDQLEPR